MFGLAGISVLAPDKDGIRPSLRMAYGELFLEIFLHAGDTHRERGDSVGASVGSISDRARGRKLPDKVSRGIIAIAAQALRDLPDDEAREDLVRRGLALMREIEADNGAEE